MRYRTAHKGFTLIELVIGIVVFGIAMLAFISFFVPQIAGSVNPHYQARAAALGQSFMSEVLSKAYDHESDHDGGLLRCDAEGPSCTDILGEEPGESPGNYNDVDDYIGCWYTAPTRPSSCSSIGGGNLSDIFGEDIRVLYPNFQIEVGVEEVIENGRSQFKTINMDIRAGGVTELSLIAQRGNY